MSNRLPVRSPTAAPAVPASAPIATLVPPGTAAPWALRMMLLVALVFALREAQPLLAPVVIAVVLTFVFAPAVRWLRRRGVPEYAGAGLLVLTLLATTFGLASSLARPATEWWDKLPTTVTQLLGQFDRVRAAIPGLAPPQPQPAPPARAGTRAGTAASNPPPTPPADPVKERLASEGMALTGKLLGHSVTVALSVAATLILLYFLLASEHWMLSRCVEAIPRRRTRAIVLGGVRAAQREIGQYLVALGCINAGAGLITDLGLWAVGLPNPTLWGAVVAVLCFVPYLGPMAIMVMLLLAGMMTFTELPQMLAPFGVFAVIHALESNVFSPWVVGRRLSLSPISVFLSVMFWGWVWGIAGALISVPLLIALRTVCRRRRGLRLLSRFLEGDQRELPTLRALLRPRRPVVRTRA